MTCRRLARTSTAILLLCIACGGDDGDAETGADTSPASTSAADASDSSTLGVVESSSGAAESTTATTDADTTAGACEGELPAIVTDIDETLTLSDEEFLMQLMDGNYDPVEREGGAALIGGYADLGYRIMYLTAR